MTRSDPATALLVVDMQNDFCPGGALGVAGARPLAPAIAEAARAAGTVVATRDWHPPDHCSFAVRGGPWPAHCVAGTPGAELHPSVAGMRFDRVQDKGTDRDREAYSGFDGTDLADYLRGRGVERVLVTGVATDYCVRATALDADPGGLRDHRAHRRRRRRRRAARRRRPGARRGARPPAAGSTGWRSCATRPRSSRSSSARRSGCAR